MRRPVHRRAALLFTSLVGPVGEPAKPPLDSCCVAALIVAIVVGWCPLIGSLAAILVAGIGLRRVARATPPRRGAGLAWAAIALAVAIPIIEGYALENMQTRMVQQMDLRASDTVTRTLRGDEIPKGRWLAKAAGGATPEQIQAFAKDLRARLGELREVRVTNRTVSGVMDPEISAVFIAEFERGNAFGNAIFARGPLDGWSPSLVARSIELDISGERVQIPPAPLTASAPATGSASEPVSAPNETQP